MTAVAAQKVFNNEFKECRVKIAFNPFAALDYANGNNEAEIFAVQTPAHLKASIEFLIFLKYSVLRFHRGLLFQNILSRIPT